MSIFERFGSDDISVIVSELLIATAESADPLLDSSIHEVLGALRFRMKMDVVFVSEFVNGKRVFRFVDTRGKGPELRPGDSNPLEETFCQRIVDGRLPSLIKNVAALPAGAVPPLPFRLGAHLSTPIMLSDGSAYGTLCCFSEAPNLELQEDDLKTLRHCASLVARKIDLAKARGVKELPPDWKAQQMVDEYQSSVWGIPSRPSSSP
jgi:hypothetical protein